jgi:hypothetical protein
MNRMKIHPRNALHTLSLLGSFVVFLAATQMSAQDWVHTGTNLGSDRIRIAAADFKPVGADPQAPALKAVFDATLYSDLAGAWFAAGNQFARVVGCASQCGHGRIRGALGR